MFIICPKLSRGLVKVISNHYAGRKTMNMENTNEKADLVHFFKQLAAIVCSKKQLHLLKLLTYFCLPANASYEKNYTVRYRSSAGSYWRCLSFFSRQ
jgi:hypothetical protein